MPAVLSIIIQRNRNRNKMDMSNKKRLSIDEVKFADNDKYNGNNCRQIKRYRNEF